MRSGNRKHLLLDLAAIGLALILLVILGWRTLLAQESDSYSQFLPLIRGLPRVASDLEVWCVAEGETWDAVYSTCIVDGDVTVSPSVELTVLMYEAIHNFGTIDNFGYITNYSYITNYGAIQNYGAIHNYRTIYNDGFIFNNCSGIYTDILPVGNSIVYRPC